MSHPPVRFRPRPLDPGEAWADAALAPLRDRVAGVDVAPGVMRRIAASRLAPPPAPMPQRWQRASWAATLILGLLAVGLLVGTAGVMVLAGDQGARTAWTLVLTAGRLAVHGYGHAGNLAAGLVQAAFAIVNGAWPLVSTAAPLVRGAGLMAALAGLASIAVSLYVVSRAKATAPVAERRDHISLSGGSS